MKNAFPLGVLQNGMLYTYPSLSADLNVDVLILGAGITGSLIAHQCIEDGYTTAVIDENHVGMGNTAASVGLIDTDFDVDYKHWYNAVGAEKAVALSHFSLDAFYRLETLCNLINKEVGYTKKNLLHYAASKKQVDRLQAQSFFKLRSGQNFKWLDFNTIADIYGLQNTYGGFVCSEAATIDAYKLTHELLQYNIYKGLKVFDKTKIKRIKYSNRGVIAITNDSLIVRAKKLINATGTSFDDSIPEHLIHKKFYDACLTESMSPALLNQLQTVIVKNTQAPQLHFYTTSNNRLIIKSEVTNSVNSITEGKRLKDKGKIPKYDKIVKALKADILVKEDFVWQNSVSTTLDGFPIIDHHPAYKNTLIVSGLGCNGINFAACGMELVSYFLKGKKHPLAYHFGTERFGNLK